MQMQDELLLIEKMEKRKDRNQQFIQLIGEEEIKRLLQRILLEEQETSIDIYLHDSGPSGSSGSCYNNLTYMHVIYKSKKIGRRAKLFSSSSSIEYLSYCDFKLSSTLLESFWNFVLKPSIVQHKHFLIEYQNVTSSTLTSLKRLGDLFEENQIYCEISYEDIFD
jgi:hypothetical protein